MTVQSEAIVTNESPDANEMGFREHLFGRRPSPNRSGRRVRQVRQL